MIIPKNKTIMEPSEVITRIRNCINNAHSFSETLGKSTSIHRDYLLKNLNDISATEIHQGLLELQENGEVELGSDFNMILLK